MIICHHNDHDGQCAAAVVLHHYNQFGTSFVDSIRLEAVNYNKPFPFDKIAQDEQVFVLDFSLGEVRGEWDRLLAITPFVIWIDHHRSAIEKAAKNPKVDSLPGIRDTSEAGCVLTWRYLFKGQDTPHAVELVGDRDIWRFAFGDETRLFFRGLTAYDTDPRAHVWTNLLNSDFGQSEIRCLVEEGRTIDRYYKQTCKEYINNWAFELEIDGHAVIACNRSQGSEAFGELEKAFPIMMPFIFDGTNFVVSMYSTRGVDVGRIAERFGGGGHPGAAGFTIAPEKFLAFLQYYRNTRKAA